MWIDDLAEGEIFVFGSNALGHHRGGAARTAHQKFGAKWGQGHGPQGRSYAIDSMSGLAVLDEEVQRFYAFALDNPDLRFLVTPIGTGIAGHPTEAVAPLFANPPGNVVLPGEFVTTLDRMFLEEQPLSVRETVATPLRDVDGPDGIVPTSALSTFNDESTGEASGENGTHALRHALADLKSQVRELIAMPAVEHEGVARHTAQYYPRPAEERFWRLDVPARTEAHVLRALADTLDLQEPTEGSRMAPSEHVLLQYLSRARYARGHWELVAHPVEMGDAWWAVQLKHLVCAREALDRHDTPVAARALAAAAHCPSNGWADIDYVLEALTELALLERENDGDPAPSEWAAVALTLASGAPGWTPGRWFSEVVLERIEQIAHTS